MSRAPLFALIVSGLASLACGEGVSDDAERSAPEGYDYVKSEDGKADSSLQAVFLDFTFEGSLLVRSPWSVDRYIDDQLLYTMGQLNGQKSVGRLDKVQISDVKTSEPDDEGLSTVTYRAVLPVAWGKRDAVPETYELILPRRIGGSALGDFAETYGHDCVDWGAHDVDAGSMWYYFRPERRGCQMDDADVLRVAAAVTPSSISTTGKFPEYDKIYEDDVLKVVAVFGKYEDGATTEGDAGIRGYNLFVAAMADLLGDRGLSTEPAEIPTKPGVETPDIVMKADLGGGRRVEIVALLVDNVRTAGRTFDRRYEALSRDADLIAYNGHAGLGSNIRALARKGDWVGGQYVVVFMNGCDTYAYVDAALWDAHADVNPDDPLGTKYVDIVSNAMPSFFRSMPSATIALVKGLMQHEAPATYETMFKDVDSAQVVLVSGEEDNTFVPGGTDEPDDLEAWEGLSAEGTLAKAEERRFETPSLPAGRYRFEISGSGDADLYIRVGAAPTTAAWDCRPYKSSSNEICQLDLPAPAPIHVMVRGYGQHSEFVLKGEVE